MSYIIKHGGGAIFVWDCMISFGMSYMRRIEGKSSQALHLSILQDGDMKTIEWCRLNSPRVMILNILHN